MDWTFVFQAVDHYVQSRQYERAHDLLEQIQRRDPNNTEVRERLGFLRTLERRRARRIPVEIVAILTRGEKRGGFPARIIEVSRVGLHVLAAQAVKKGEKLGIEIPSKISLETPLELPCIGIWCQPKGDSFDAGLELDSLDRKEQMALLERALEGYVQPAG